VQQLSGIPINADCARTLIARHRSAARGREDARDGFPPKQVAIEQADAGSVGVALVGRDLHKTLQYVARIVGHLAREQAYMGLQSCQQRLILDTASTFVPPRRRTQAEHATAATHAGLRRLDQPPHRCALRDGAYHFFATTAFNA
jgi:hypothetical protein